jgi:hypothetical protein
LVFCVEGEREEGRDYLQTSNHKNATQLKLQRSINLQFLYHPNCQPNQRKINERIWRLASGEKDGAIYTMPGKCRLPEFLDGRAFEIVREIGCNGPGGLHSAKEVDTEYERSVYVEDSVVEEQETEFREKLLHAELRTH